MQDIELWQLILIGIIVGLIQASIHKIFTAYDEWKAERKNNQICELYINGKYNGLHTFIECCTIYQNAPYEHTKQSEFDKKNTAVQDHHR